MAIQYGFPDMLAITDLVDVPSKHKSGQWAMSVAMRSGYDLHDFIHQVYHLDYVHTYGTAGVIHGAMWYLLANSPDSDFTGLVTHICDGFLGAEAIDCLHGTGHGAMLSALSAARPRFHVKPCSGKYFISNTTLVEIKYAVSVCRNLHAQWQQQMCYSGLFHSHLVELSLPNRSKTRLTWPPCEHLEIGADACIHWRMVQTTSLPWSLHWDPISLCLQGHASRNWRLQCILAVSMLFAQYNAFNRGIDIVASHPNACCRELTGICFNPASYVFPAWNRVGRWNRSLSVSNPLLNWCQHLTQGMDVFDGKAFETCVIGSMTVPGVMLYFDPLMENALRQTCSQLLHAPYGVDRNTILVDVCWRRVRAISDMYMKRGPPVADWYYVVLI